MSRPDFDKVPVLHYCGTFDKDYAEVCKYVPLDNFEKVYRALRDLMDEIDTLEDIQFCRDLEPYKAEAVWDDVTSRASKALKAKP